MKKVFSVFALVGSFLLFGSGCAYVTPYIPVQDDPAMPVSESENIVIEFPIADSDISNPLRIFGQARVFENNVSWRVKYFDDTIVASGFTTANAPDIGQFGAYEVFVPITTDWQSGAYRVEVLSYSAKDGSEQDLASVPAYLGSNETQTLNLSFVKNPSGNLLDCTKTEQVTREVNKTLSPARVAMMLLLEGPTSENQANGYSTSIPAGTILRSINLEENGNLTVDLSGTIAYGLGGSCLVQSIEAQIIDTMKQFPTVSKVTILIDGEENKLQP